MPHSPHASSAAGDVYSPAASLSSSLYAERIATPTFPTALRPPAPITSPLRNPSQPSKGFDSRVQQQLSRETNNGNGNENGNGGAFSASSRASPSTVTADGVFASQNHSFSYPPLGVTLDEEQRRCVNTAFHISFHGNPRVKHKPTCVELPNGASFLVVDRFVSGNSNGVYDKNKKMWEQIPVGQARVFVRTPHAAKHVDAAAALHSSSSSGVHVNTSVKGADSNNEDDFLTAPTIAPSAAGAVDTAVKPSPVSNTSRVFQVPPRSPAGPGATTSSASSPTPQMSSSVHNNNNSKDNNNSDWTCVASAVGLRKMGHWREATTVYSLHKEVAKSAIALEKVDGESGQLSAFTWKGQRYWVVGCRYQHIVTRLDVPEADLVRYATATSSSTSADSSASSTSSSPSADRAAEEVQDVSTGLAAAGSITSPAASPTTSAAHHRGGTASSTRDAELRSTHSSSFTAATALTSGGLTSEASYLDLAVRMARLWRHVLEALPAEEEGEGDGEGEQHERQPLPQQDHSNELMRASDNTTTPTTTIPPANAGVLNTSKLTAVEALHARIAADRRTLCFDAILTGWERLQAFSALHGFSPDASSAGTATPVSSSCSPRTAATQPASSSAVFASPSSLTTSTWETEIPLWFYAVTWDGPMEGRGWCMPVLRARDFFVQSHLPFVPTSAPVELGSPAYEALRQSVLSRCDTAGAVLYGANVDVDECEGNSSDDDYESGGGNSNKHPPQAGSGGDETRQRRRRQGSGMMDDGMVVQVWKCRAYPHTLERVVQEYVVTHRLCGDPLRNKMKKKVSSLSRETRLCIKQWELHRLPFLVDFALWLHREKYITPSTDLAALKNIRGHWLSYQEKFKDVLLAQLQRQQHRLSARPSSLSTLDVSRREERTDDETAVYHHNNNSGSHGDAAAEGEAAVADEDSVDPIMLVGPQGCGKSTMARILYALLEEAGAAPRWLNQDEVGTRTAYLAAIRRAVTRGTYSHVLLDKMNLDDKARADYTDIGVKPVLVVAWRHTGGTAAMVHACYDRVVQRGSCHRTFFHGDAALSVSSRSPELRPAASPVTDTAASPLSVGGVPAAWLSASTASTTAAASLTPSPALSTFSPPPPVLQSPLSASPAPSSSSRLQGILEASARRYTAPANLPCVELDVTWDCRHAVEVVWEALRDRGTCELPPLSELNVDQALQTAYAYERLLATYPTRVATAVLRGPSAESLLAQLGACRPPLIPRTLRLQPQVEVLLHDFQLNPSPTALVRYASQVNTTRRLTVQAVVSNSKVVLLLVLGPSESAAAALVATGSAEPNIATAASAPLRSRVSAATLAGTEGPVSMTPTVSQDLEDYLESQTQQEQWAVVAKAKKVTADYCEALAQRVRDDPEDDPYCAVRWLSPPLALDFTVAFTFP